MVVISYNFFTTIPFLLLPHLIEKFRQWQRTLIAESSCPVHLMWKMDALVLSLATKLVIWQGPPIANFWWKLQFYFGASLWHKQCSEITCGFTFLSWLATPLSYQLSVLHNQKPESFSFFTFRLRLVFLSCKEC